MAIHVHGSNKRILVPVDGSAPSVRGLRRLAMGSDAELVVRSSPTPVVLVRQDVA